MEKRMQLPTKLQKYRVNQNIISGVQICELPDEILIAILSRLTMKEAACTTVLSHRWKNLWTHTTGSLDFDGSNILWTCKLKVEKCLRDPEPVQERPAFIRWVYRILQSHKGATIDEFRVHFDLDSSSTSYIDSWINFALKKRAQRLELDLEPERVAVHWKRMYPFPTESVMGHPTINSLTSLKLNYVGVTQELLEYVLSNCHFLKFLCVCSSQILVGAQVVAAPPKLEYMEISYCQRVKFLEISSAINLRTLKNAGPIARLCFKNAPNLTDVSFGSQYAGDIVKKFHEHSIPPSQIEKLKLDLSFYPLESLDGFPNLENLKQLELVVTGGEQSGIRYYTTLLEKCPMLYRLCVKFKWLRFPNKIVMQEKECRLNSLNFVEIAGFHGGVPDVELATFLVTNAPCLEKITIDTRFPLHFTGTLLEVLQKENMAAKERARQLSTKLSPSVEFLIL